MKTQNGRENFTPTNPLLTQWGWNEAWAEKLTAFVSRKEEFFAGRVVADFGNRLRVVSEAGEVEVIVSLLWKDLYSQKFGMPAVGDWIVGEGIPKAGNISRLIGILPRRSEIRRLDSFRATSPVIETIVSNVDKIFVVTAANCEFNYRKIARLMSQALESGAETRVILNKVDLLKNREEYEHLFREQWPDVPVHYTSAAQGTGLPEIESELTPGETVAFIGSSGVGKSSLVNALMGEQRMRVHQTSATKDKGTHTTTRREMLLMPSGAVLIDTPGLRSIALTATKADLGTNFDDIEELRLQCKFRDCHHDGEPGCALASALGEGILSQERFDAYMYLNGLLKPNKNLPIALAKEKEKWLAKREKKKPSLEEARHRARRNRSYGD